MNTSSHVGVREAAAAFGISESTVIRRCRSREIPSVMEGGKWLIARTALPAGDQPAETEPDYHPITSNGRRLAEGPALLNLEQAAELMGISVHTLRIGVRRGQIGSLRLGGRIMIPAVAVADALNIPRPALDKIS